MRTVLALGTGLVLGAAPFLRYRHPHDPAAAHANHEARHGGQLGMVGEYHLELVRRAGAVEVFVSDALRRPVPVRAGSVAFDGGAAMPLAWRGYRMVGVDRLGAAMVEARVILDDATPLVVAFDLR